MSAYSFPAWKQPKPQKETTTPACSMLTALTRSKPAMSKIGLWKIAMRKIDWPTIATPKEAQKKRVQ
ncbi:MAG: hypothetical protein WAN72_16515 [Candidatus Acidiferrales bacterium]